MYAIIFLAFLSGFMFSPWAGGLLLTLSFILLIELIYGSLWTWHVWRLGVIIASLAGWALGKAIFLPWLIQRGWKEYIDNHIQSLKDNTGVNFSSEEVKSWLRQIAEYHGLTPPDKLFPA